MDKKELSQQYTELERKFDANKARRAIMTVLAFAVAFFVILYIVEKPEGIEILYLVPVSIIMAGINFFVNSIVFTQLCNVSNSENKVLEEIRKKLQE